MIAYKGDREGTGQILRENCRGITDQATRAIAADIAAQWPDAEVAVNHYTTDRAAGSITILHPAARLRVVRDGLFTRAAGSLGLQVRLR